ncbi:MAG: hypothetical protein LBM87_03630, partial [Ruminococcus sp.]|nr:hypothetical protein [Ruminococcus sp.]
MTFDEKIIIAVDNIPVPDSLSPDNIANMLKSTQRTETRSVVATQLQKTEISRYAARIVMSRNTSIANCNPPQAGSPVTKRNVIFK